MQSDTKSETIRSAVRHYYAQTAQGCRSKSCGESTPCCGDVNPTEKLAQAIGYSPADLRDLPQGANLGLGCGNPQALADLKPGEAVLDLGSGAGFDCFLAARRVGPSGRVIGVDMTPEMVAKARENARQARLSNVEFYLGEIEHLPLPTSSVDVAISNCVINLSPEKSLVFKEIFRVLKPGGRIAISDIVALAPLPQSLRENLEAVASCVGGAQTMDEIKKMLEAAGFTEIGVAIDQSSREIARQCMPENQTGAQVASAAITAVKPDEGGAFL
jgi:SAM-dependent methyltransferase